MNKPMLDFGTPKKKLFESKLLFTFEDGRKIIMTDNPFYCMVIVDKNDVILGVFQYKRLLKPKNLQGGDASWIIKYK